MSISAINSNISRLQKEIAGLQKKLSEEKSKESSAAYKANQLQSTLKRVTSQSTINSKLRQIQRYQDDITRALKNQSDIQNKISKKSTEMVRYQQQLAKEQETERKKQDDLQKKLEKERKQQHDSIMKELITQKEAAVTISNIVSTTGGEEEDFYDLFISHSSDDKEEFVRPLVEALQKEGVKVWYDEFTLKVGDRLRRSIDNGLKHSSFGVLVLSSSFFRKNWTQYEFDGLIAQEMASGNKRILPIWHKVSRDEVMKFSPTLGDVVALDSTRSTIKEIAKDLASLVK